MSLIMILIAIAIVIALAARRHRRIVLSQWIEPDPPRPRISPAPDAMKALELKRKSITYVPTEGFIADKPMSKPQR